MKCDEEAVQLRSGTTVELSGADGESDGFRGCSDEAFLRCCRYWTNESETLMEIFVWTTACCDAPAMSGEKTEAMRSTMPIRRNHVLKYAMIYAMI
jgi:hypothetical protein